MSVGLAVVAIAAAVVVVLAGQSADTGEGGPAAMDTHVQMIIDGYKAKFTWSAPMMNALQAEGLVTTPQSVNTMFMTFQSACVGGKDALAGQPERTRRDMADLHVEVTPDQALRLNAAQEEMCARMPLGSWFDTPTAKPPRPGAPPR